MNKVILLLSFSFVFSLYASFYREEFVKICKRCNCTSHEVQLYAYNEWTKTWEKSWRSDTNRPGCCEECYFKLQPRVKYLEPPMKVHISGGYYDVDSVNNGNPQLLKEHERWWNNGHREVMSKSRPIGLNWRLGRLPRLLNLNRNR